MNASGGSRPALLVLSSTYPRWDGDHEPGFVHELSKRLAARFDVIALVPSSPGALPREVLDGVEIVRYRYAPRRYETLVNAGGIVTNLRRQPWKWLLVPSFLFAQYVRAALILRQRQRFAIHAHWLIPQGVIAALLSVFSTHAPRLVVTSHGADLFALRGRAFAHLRAWVVGRADEVTVVSDAMRENLERAGVDVRKVSVQPMGVDLRDRFAPDATTQRSRAEILFVGRLVEKKGLRHLLDAMPSIIALHSEAVLTIAGFGPEEASLRAHSDALGLADRVRFLGAVPQSRLPALYRRAAAFVAPFVEAKSGDQEGFGLVLVEALGCGCPVIASDLPATRSTLSSVHGAIGVPPGDSDALAVAIGTVLADPESFAARAAADRESLLERYDWSPVADRYAATLRGQ